MTPVKDREKAELIAFLPALKRPRRSLAFLACTRTFSALLSTSQLRESRLPANENPIQLMEVKKAMQFWKSLGTHFFRSGAKPAFFSYLDTRAGKQIDHLHNKNQVVLCCYSNIKKLGHTLTLYPNGNLPWDNYRQQYNSPIVWKNLNIFSTFLLQAWLWEMARDELAKLFFPLVVLL